MTMTRKAICIFIPALIGGGAERVAVNLANAFTEEGREVHIVVIHGEGKYWDILSPKVKVFNLNCQRVRFAFRPFLHYLRTEKPRSILSFLQSCNVLAILANLLTLRKARLVISERTVYSKEKVLRSTFLNFLMRKTMAMFLYRFADDIVVVAKSAAEDLDAYAGFRKGRVKYIYNPTITSELLSLAQEKITHPWFGGQMPVILSAGRLHYQKNFPLLIEAFSELIKTTPARLMILGEGEDKEALEALIRQKGIASSVELAGFQKNPYQFMKHASLFVLSSRYEGLPNVLIEALACGTPVISTDCESGPREILDNGKYGMLVPVGDKQSLVDAMKECLSHPGKHKQMAAEFQNHAMKQYSREYAAGQYLNLLLNEGPHVH
jgi:glycosyltransferase involved in cell wall biosynthesis